MVNKIGVFDSGLGGVFTTLKIREAYPMLDIIYVGDTLHMPYGQKTKDQIIDYAYHITQYLIDQGCQMIVIACNTVSSTALEYLRSTFQTIPIIGTIEPTIKQVKDAQAVLVLATNLTVESNSYVKAIQTLNPNIQVIQQKASELVLMVEHQEVNEQRIEEMLLPYKYQVDMVILGCTHFPLLIKEISRVLTHSKIVDSNQPMIEEMKPYINDGHGQVVYYSTHLNAQLLATVAQLFQSEVVFKLNEHIFKKG